MENTKIYPVPFEGKLWQEDEVSDLFRAFYFSVESLDWQSSVYVGDGLRILPDGKFIEE